MSEQIKKDSLSKFEKFSKWLSVFRTILLDIAIISLILVFGFLAYKELKKETIIIDPFQVPQDLEKQNITGQAIVNELIDKIDSLKSSVNVRIKKLDFKPTSYESQLEIEIPGSGISVKSLLQSLKDNIGFNRTKINGEVMTIKDSIYITIRVLGKAANTFSGNMKDLNKILWQATEHILKYTQPATLTSYYYSQGIINNNDTGMTKCLNIIDFTIKNSPKDECSIAYNQWGLVLMDLGHSDVEKAIEKFRKAIELNPSFPEPYCNLGILLKRQGKLDEATENFKMSIDLDSSNTLAHLNLALAFDEQKKFNEAISEYNKVIELDPNNSSTFNNLGIIFRKQGKADYAANMFKKASEIDPNNLAFKNNLEGILGKKQIQ